MATPRKILVLGASYGLLLASKLLLAGHTVKLVCLPAEAELINAEGIRVRMPVKGRSTEVEIDSRKLPGQLSAGLPHAVDPGEYDLVVLGMQEPQYRLSGVRELVEAIARARVPCVSIMNMPPLPYLVRIPGVSTDACRHCYTEPDVWDDFDPALVTLCSPDPQAVRPPDEPTNVLQVRLATNFKAARFESEAPTALLRELESGIEASRFPVDGSEMELPVKLRIHESVLAPLAKWSMLIAGNYRCIQPDGIQSVRAAVHGDLDTARRVYDWVVDVCKALGATDQDMVPFDKYANAANSLTSPSSVARALSSGAHYIERVDCLVKTIAAQKGMHAEVLDDLVALVDAKLEANRQAVAVSP